MMEIEDRDLEKLLIEYNITRNVDLMSFDIIYAISLTIRITNENSRFNSFIKFMLNVHIFSKA